MTPPYRYDFAGCALRSDERTLIFHRRRISLAPKAIDVLIVLLEHPGVVVPKNELLERVWPDAIVEEANLTQYVHLLRRAFNANGINLSITTVPRVGYRLDCAVVKRDARIEPDRRWLRAWGAACAMLALAVMGITILVAQRRDPDLTLPSDAARWYALARSALTTGSADEIRRSVTLFDRVVRTSPKSPLGYAGLADAYTTLALIDAPLSDGEKRDAIARAKQAVALDPHLAQAQTSLGGVQAFVADDARSGEAAFRLALAADDRYPLAHLWYGELLAGQARLTAARDQFELGLRLDPLLRSSATALAWDYYLLRDYGRAAAFCRDVLAVSPRNTTVAYVLALTYEQTSRRAAARELLQHLSKQPALRIRALGALAELDARSGNRVSALREIAELEDTNAHTAAKPFALAFALAAVGDSAEAWHWLERVPSGDRMWLSADPRMARFETDVRFTLWYDASRQRSYARDRTGMAPQKNAGLRVALRRPASL